MALSNSNSLPDSSAIGPRPEQKLFVCTICKRSFSREEHLSRHVPLHTGEKRYECPCGHQFFRMDLLARHLSRCTAPDNADRLVKKTGSKQTRVKRACDRCARLKSKCDFRTPCDRCCQKSLVCNFSREGRHDPYGAFHIGADVSISLDADDQAEQRLVEILVPTASQDSATCVSTVSSSASKSQILDQPISELSPTESAQMLSETARRNFRNNIHMIASRELGDQYNMYPFDMNPSLADFDFGETFDNPKDIDFMSLDPPWMPSCEPSQAWSTSPVDTQGVNNLVPRRFSPCSAEGFMMGQIDPIEAKCVEIRRLLKGSEQWVTEDVVTTYVTRENLVQFTQLFGEKYQHNFPFLHCPTFNLAETSPFLSLAIMLVGACYSDSSILAAHTIKLMMRLLKLVENEPASFFIIGITESIIADLVQHELNMQLPTFSTVQASLAVCSVLVCVRSETACKFVAIHFARTISMAKRAGIFNPTEPVDYRKLTEETFDWRLWVERESRKRLACQIYCHDIASCIFQGESPLFSHLTFNVPLPCYEACWEARTASTCLHELQSHPEDITAAGAMRKLTSFPTDVNAPLLETSGFGMFVLVKGLHCLLFHALQCDFELSSTTDANSARTGHAPEVRTADLVSHLQQDMSGPTVSAMADQVIATVGSATLRYINNALNAWRTTWDLRCYRDVVHENTFIGDPLPFWWLAKLYLVLHYDVNLISDDSEFAVPRAQGGNELAKFKVQSKILGWLSRFRHQTGHVSDEPPTENELLKLMNLCKVP